MTTIRLGLALAVTSLAAATAIGTAVARPTVSTVSVTASDFKFKLSTNTVKRGAVTFKVVNKGQASHDFKIAGRKTRLLEPGTSATLRVVFAKAGRYPYLCTVPGHAQLGMKGVLTVK